jgi:hypothetical protein
MKKSKRSAIISLLSGATLLQSGSCTQDFARMFRDGLASVLVGAALDVVDAVVLQPVLDDVVPPDNAG